MQVCTLLIVGLLYKRPEDMAGLRVAWEWPELEGHVAACASWAGCLGCFRLWSCPVPQAQEQVEEQQARPVSTLSLLSSRRRKHVRVCVSFGPKLSVLRPYLPRSILYSLPNLQNKVFFLLFNINCLSVIKISLFFYHFYAGLLSFVLGSQDSLRRCLQLTNGHRFSQIQIQ